MSHISYRFILAVPLISVVFSKQMKPQRLEELYRTLSYDLEVVLQRHLANWNHLTQSDSHLDLGEVFDKEWLSKDLQRANGRKFTIDIYNVSRPNKKNFLVSYDSENIDNLENSKGKPTVDDDAILKAVNSYKENKVMKERNKSKNPANSNDRSKGRSTRSSASRMPVMYMPGQKKKRQCVEANGIFSGYNAFSYLSFITGVLSLVLNVNNNINNNNNNNNLNDNNDISNNNVDANSNSQTANQIVVFPPGRKRRSIADWFLQVSQMQLSSTPRPSDDNDGGSSHDCLRRNGFSRQVMDGFTAGLSLLTANVLDDLELALRQVGYKPVRESSFLCPTINGLASKGGVPASMAKIFRSAQREKGSCR